MRHLTITALLVALLCAPFTANAWWVKVRNPTDTKVYVKLHYGLMYFGGFKSAWIEPGSTYTFDLGADCPRGLMGHTPENSKSGSRSLMSTDMHGTWYNQDVNFAVVSCANFNIEICKMPEGHPPYIYSFCIDRSK